MKVEKICKGSPKTNKSNQSDIAEIFSRDKKVGGLEPIGEEDIKDHYTDSGERHQDEQRAVSEAAREYLLQ